ncbi:hypothetical protein GGI01_003007 [Coemansia sp. RSA 376]|nr:hypothetical protein GGI01_003007 [Coemansia sp. RSA 376]
MSIVIGTSYVWNIVTATVMGLQTAAMSGCASRQKERLGLPHSAEVGSRATEKLSDAENDEFARFQKVHQAHVEYLPLAQSSVLLAGLFYPKLSAYLGAAYIAGRFVYSFGYIRNGPEGRKWGVMLICPSVIALLGASFYGSFKALALLADAFAAIADVFELVGARAKQIERTRDKAVPVVCAHDEAELERVLGPKPKTPLTVSRLYYLDHAKAVSTQNPDLNGKAVKRYIAAQWENISDEERQTYRDRYTALKRQYDIDTAAYNTRKKAFLSTYTESMSTARLAETHAPSVLPSPEPEPERASPEPERASPEPESASPPISLCSPPLTTVSFTEPDCSMLSISQGPPPPPPSIEHLDELQSSIILVLPGSPPPPTEPLDDLQSPMQSVSPGLQPQSTPYLHVPRQPTPPISSGSLPQPTVPFAEPERSTLSKSPGPSPRPTEQQHEDMAPNVPDYVLDLKLGPMPKPPAPADRMYCESAAKDILRENPGMHSIEAVRLAHIRWNSLSEEDRQPFKDRFDALAIQFKVDIDTYNVRKEAFLSTYSESLSTMRIADPEPSTASLSPGPPHWLTEQQYQDAEPNIDEVLERELGPRPKPSAPADRMYCESATKDILRENPGMHSIEAVRLAHIRWNSLSEEDRQTLKGRCDALNKQYNIDIVAYDARKEAFLSTYSKPVSTAYPNVADEVSRQELGLMPKRPPSAIRLYIRRVTGDIRRENPGMGFETIDKLAATRWKNLSEAGRRPFLDHHHALKRRYKAGIAAHNAYKEAFLSTHGESVPKTPVADHEPSTSSLLPGPSIQPTVSGAEPEPSTSSLSRGHPPKLRKQQNKDDVLDRELGPKPIRPQHAVRLYSNSVIGDIRRENPGMKCAEIHSVASSRWRNLSEEDRRPFEDCYHELKRKYDAEIAAYNARKQAFLSTHGESVSTTPIADPEPSTSSLSPGPPIQPTVSGAEPEPSTSSLSRGPPPQSTKQQNMDDVLERELGPKPIRPQPAVRLYSNSVIGDIRRENPGMKGAESFPVASIRWKNLSKEDRRPFEDRYYELKMKYNTNIAAYNARKEAFLSTYGESVSTTPIADRELSTSSLSPGLPHRLTGKRHQGAEPNAADDVLERVLGPRPKPPAPADRMYCESATKDILRENPGMPSIEAVRLAHIRWNSLSDEDRKPFKGRYDALKRKYNADVAAYNARKEAFLSTYSESVSATRIADRELSTFSISPRPPLQPTERLNKPECATASVPQTRLPPIDPLGPSGPVGYPAPSLSLLPPGAASWFTIPLHVPWSAPLSESVSRPAGHRGPSLPAESSGTVALAHPLSISWPAELALPDQSPALSSLPANSDGLPEPTMAIEYSILPTQATVTATATLAQPVVPLEPLPVGIRPMSLDIPDTTDTVALVNSPVLPFSMSPPTLEKESPVCTLPINPVESVKPAELPTATKTKVKKKKRRAADNDDDDNSDVQEPGADQSTSQHRKKAKRAKIDMKEGKKKHKPKPVVKTEDNVEEAATNKENDNAGLDTVAQTPV